MPRVESAVRDLLEASETTRPPVDVYAIAEALGVIVAEAKMSSDVSGMLLREGPESTVGLNRAHAATRKRFTLAHELGHLQLHRGRPLIVDAAVRVNLRDVASAAATSREEIEANQFAAGLLMPTELVLDAVQNSGADTPEQLQHGLARLFRVSTEAMGYRLINLGLIS